ncbi:anti-sigma-K factor [Corynebacterium phocae]|uniref:Anti-sigma-K factor n=1 Tax=Corynebacterium phocae TaxID=161895 RepID=A0A1L7D712_9CORY|nr:anti-sigma-K factor [Corynebacterium phocae]KAA8722261.1 anti-sigma factor [Corynebacterium phocae]
MHDIDEETFAAFLDSVPEKAPPPGVKDRVIQGVVVEQAEAEIIELKSRRDRWFAPASAAAAAVVLIAGAYLILPQNNGSDQPTESVIALDGEQQMHEIMAAEDAVMATTSASGASLAIVVSSTMGKAGAMVDGQPELKDGMGAQVWVVDDSGNMISAGVIGQDPHEDVWMPFPEQPTKVMVTEEPMSGSDEPTGRTLAEVKLSA